MKRALLIGLVLTVFALPASASSGPGFWELVWELVLGGGGAPPADEAGLSIEPGG